MTDPRTRQAEALLQNLQKRQGGQLKIFLGAAPGVGKTYAMLNAAREQLQQGVEVVVGLVETHGRKDTEALLTGLELLPRRSLDYGGHGLTEFDLDAALQRKPKLILVDELAHTNVPGSRHKRRYQDIEELLAADIDVYTTLNIQHLASLNDLVLQITGVRVRETVPDQFIDRAHEIVFVDLPPDNLIERLRQGKVYLPEYARSALDSFFSRTNLTALREVAMREVMERVDSQLQTELHAQTHPADYRIQEKLLVLISHRSDHQYLIRVGRQIADKRQIPWMVVWVDTGQAPSQPQLAQVQAAMALARDLGAATETLRGLTTFHTVLPFIREQRINQVLLGAGTRHTLLPWRKRLYQKLIGCDLPLEVTVYAEPGGTPAIRAEEQTGWASLGDLHGHLWGLAAVSVASLLTVGLQTWLNSGNLVLIYVLGVVAVGLRFGAQPALSTAVLSFLSFNFFLTEPRFTFSVNKQDDLSTLIFLLVIALICGPAASRIRRQFLLLKETNRYSEALRALAQKLAVAGDDAALWQAVTGELGAALQAECVAVMTDQDNHCVPEPSTPFNHVDNAAIEWSKKQGANSGRLTDTLGASDWTLFPVRQQQRVVAIVLLRFNSAVTSLQTYDRDLINAMLQQAADAWQRLHLTRDLESARVKGEVEQLRSALLSSVSHDLRSPLSAMMGAADSLRVLDAQLTPEDRHDLIDTILQESRRLDRYIQNLLDMTRLGHGTLKIERDWVSAADIIGSALTRLKRYFPGVQTEYRALVEPPLLYAHAALIEQALFNILENAARYSPPEDRIVVSVEAEGNRCRISIEDRGPGIPETLREKIFDMFYVVAEGDQKKNNTGMGLAICRGMIAAHGGSVQALPGSQGKGTRFVVELPIDPACDSETSRNEEPQ